MKKVILGIIIGFLLSLTTTIYASNAINAILIQAKIIINGEQKDLPSKMPIFSYNGSTYVPLRYLAENMDATVGYDSNTTTITVNHSGNGQTFG